jgi:hypothetical protein
MRQVLQLDCAQKNTSNAAAPGARPDSPNFVAEGTEASRTYTNDTALSLTLYLNRSWSLAKACEASSRCRCLVSVPARELCLVAAAVPLI